jgi:hypothetical protein
LEKIKSSSNDPRDFAHSGLLKSFIDREKTNDGEILLRYKPGKINLIKKWLKILKITKLFFILPL